MALDVTILSPQGDRRVIRVSGDGPITIGRHATCTVCIEGEAISRQHAVLRLLADGVRVQDVSSNGTLVDDEILHNQVADVPFSTAIGIGEFCVFAGPARSSEADGAPDDDGDPISFTRELTGRQAPADSEKAESSQCLPSSPPTALVETSSSPSAAAPLSSGHSCGPVEGSPATAANREEAPLQDGPSAETAPATEGGAGGGGAAGGGASAPGKELAEYADLRREIHRKLLECLDLSTTDAARLDEPTFRPRVLTALRRIVGTMEERIPHYVTHDALIGDLADEALGLGPLEALLGDPSVTEIMVVDPQTIYVERDGVLELSSRFFTDDDRVRAVIERIVTPLGRRIDEASPLVDARLRDGSRVNAIIRPLALKGSCITIRKFAKRALSLEDLVRFGTLSPEMGLFLRRSVVSRKNVVISGGTGTGKTTLLNVLSTAIPERERIVTIEDAAELRLTQPHVVSLEARPPNLEGKGEFAIRDLVRNALRMRPDRIVVGECRGGEALDMLQAMNTGHDGSLTTTHANSPAEALKRLETLTLMAGLDLPSRAIREQLATSVNLVVQISRFSDGARKVTAITEVCGLDPVGNLQLRSIYQFIQTATSGDGKVVGEFGPTGYLPSFLNQFIVKGLINPGEPYL